MCSLPHSFTQYPIPSLIIFFLYSLSFTLSYHTLSLLSLIIPSFNISSFKHHLSPSLIISSYTHYFSTLIMSFLHSLSSSFTRYHLSLISLSLLHSSPPSSFTTTDRPPNFKQSSHFLPLTTQSLPLARPPPTPHPR